MSNEQERKAFEDWMRYEFYGDLASPAETFNKERGIYNVLEHHTAWKAWQARAALAGTQSPAPLTDFVECPACEGPIAKEDFQQALVRQWASMPMDKARALLAPRPLTDVQILQLRVPRESSDPLTREFMIAFARSIERAHGIGAKQ